MAEELEIKRLSVESLDDFLDYFDHRAFLNDPNWAGCYCQFYLNDGNEPSTDNRALACDRVASGKMEGYLLYLDGKVSGWCAASNSLLFPMFPEASEQLARILCFNIDPSLRGQGMAGRMLDLVLKDLAARGFEAVEAAPNTKDYGDKSYRGSLKMYRDRDFELVTELGDGFVLVRKYLN